MSQKNSADDQVARIVATFPGPTTLLESPRKGLRELFGALVYMAISVLFLFFDSDRDAFSVAVIWFLIGLGSLVTLTTAYSLYTGARGITLDKDFLTIRQLLRTRRHRWAQTTDFEIFLFGSKKEPIVVFNDAEAHGLDAKWNDSESGRNSSIGIVTELEWDALASLLNAWRERAVAAP